MLRERVGVYVDQSNINMSGGYAMDYSVLRNFVLRGGAQGVHLNVYSAFDSAKADKDSSWASRFMGYQSAIRELGYHMKMKQSQAHDDGEKITCKANADIDIAVDVLESAGRLDRVVLVTGDGDFFPLIHAARRLGSRVEIISFDNCSSLLREAADCVFPGWLIPGLLPVDGDDCKLRGIVENTSIQGSELGAIRYMMDDFANAQPLMPMAPENCGYAIFHKDSVDPSVFSIMRGAIVEFTPHMSDSSDADQSDMRAIDITPLRICTRSGWYKPYRVE
jgi:uncharacterized LabA/DUF88 family protein